MDQNPDLNPATDGETGEPEIESAEAHGSLPQADGGQATDPDPGARPTDDDAPTPPAGPPSEAPLDDAEPSADAGTSVGAQPAEADAAEAGGHVVIGVVGEAEAAAPPVDVPEDPTSTPADSTPSPTSDVPTSDQTPAVSDVPAVGGATVRQRPARSRRASRPASAPTSEPEPHLTTETLRLDVLGELGDRSAAMADETPLPPAGAASLERIVFDSPLGSATPHEDALSSGLDADGPEPRLPVTTLLFQAPDLTQTRSRRRRAQAPSGPPTHQEEPEDRSERGSLTLSGAGRQEESGPGERTPSSGAASAGTGDASDEAAPQAEPMEDLGEEPREDDAATTEGQPRRRRRRGGRGRRSRGGTADEGSEADDQGDETGPDAGDGGAASEDVDDVAEDDAEATADDATEDVGTATSRRRRRRRRGARTGEGDEVVAPARPPRDDEVTALKGSTRLEAKRQRRREGRDSGRRRTVVTEAEFLARRESVDRAMVVRGRDGRTQIAVLEDGVLVEHFVSRRTQTTMVGNVYLGRVQNVLPSMEAAFVDLGKGRNAVLYAGEVNWDAAGMEGQPRRIEQALSAGDSVMVQVTKDPIGHKGARLTSQVTLAGRYLVLVPGGGMTGISRKLPDTERARLKRLLKEIVPESAGVIVRTASEGASEEELRRDVARLQAQWADIERKAATASAPALLSSEPDLAIRVVRDVFNEDFGSVTIAGDEAWETIAGYIGSEAPDLAPRLHRWTATDDVFAAHRIDEQLAKAMDRKVWLPSGGSLVIDRTEAMTVIDVNTGKFTGAGGTLEETVTRNNLEAAEEIVRQLRLRDIGGIIVIDFIDMVLESNRDLVLRRLVECLGRDRTRHQVAEVTSLGLVQMTRKRVGMGLLEVFSSPCECCNGRGYVISSEPVEKATPVVTDPTADDGVRTGVTGQRRRGRRSGENGAGAAAGAGARQSAARSAPEAGLGAVAAREAVKATLATIAAAAAHAHEEAAAHTGPPEPAQGSDAGGEPAREPVGHRNDDRQNLDLEEAEVDESRRTVEEDAREPEGLELGVIDFDIIRADAEVVTPPEHGAPAAETARETAQDEQGAVVLDALDFDADRIEPTTT